MSLVKVLADGCATFVVVQLEIACGIGITNSGVVGPRGEFPGLFGVHVGCQGFELVSIHVLARQVLSTLVLYLHFQVTSGKVLESPTVPGSFPCRTQAPAIVTISWTQPHLLLSDQEPTRGHISECGGGHEKIGSRKGFWVHSDHK